MELLSPAGNLEKLTIAYLYGADAAYIGLSGFSLRAQADNFGPDDGPAVARAKGSKKLYGAFNFHCLDADISRLEASVDIIKTFPFDGFIISDLGLLPFFRQHFPDVDLHLSTQANCLNSAAARIYRDLGFKRIIPGREMSLAQIASLKQAVPELEIEAFVHGAMCLAYSGRCFLSAWMTGRSANQGSCAHSCRWKYELRLDADNEEAIRNLTRSGALVLREAERPDETFPIYEGEGFTSILSSRDLCLIDHLAAFRDAGVDSLKIEGRMKSSYYVAMVTRAYRRELDRLEGRSQAGQDEVRPFIDELYKASHREYSTGFFFGDPAIQQPTGRSYEASHLFLGSIIQELEPDPAWLESHGFTAQAAATKGGAWHRYQLDVKNRIEAAQGLEYVSPNVAQSELSDLYLVDLSGRDCPRALAGRYHELYVAQPLELGTLFRKSLTLRQSEP
jgi:putative protease